MSHLSLRVPDFNTGETNMFAAQLSNKLSRPEQDMEDLLTSNVFGLWQYLPLQLVEEGLAKFLCSARRVDGAKLDLPGGIASLEIRFWPWIHEPGSNGAEPDVMVELTLKSGCRWLLLIEAKYLSPKSSHADPTNPWPTDQLAREMHNLRKIALLRSIDEYALVYVTAHTSMPSKDINEAVQELRLKTGEGSQSRFYWVTWRVLPHILASALRSSEGPASIALSDLVEIIDRMGLTFFDGIRKKGWSLGSPEWLFANAKPPLHWQAFSVGDYRFSGSQMGFVWARHEQSRGSPWRFIK